MFQNRGQAIERVRPLLEALTVGSIPPYIDNSRCTDLVLCYFSQVTLPSPALIVESSDPLRCNALIHDGFWLNPHQLLNWQPAGCMLHTYKAPEATLCLAGRRAVFIGGTSAHNIYQSFAWKFDPSIGDRPSDSDDVVSVGDLRLEFYWDPKLEGAELKRITAGFDSEQLRPALTVIGMSHEQLRGKSDLTAWAAVIGGILSSLRGDSTNRLRQSDSLIVAPMFEPNVTSLSPKDAQYITLDRVTSINTALAQLSQQYLIDVAFAFNKIIGGADALGPDGLTPESGASHSMADILLNFRCNQGTLPNHYPFASTCCNVYPNPSWVQVAGALCIALAVPFAMWLYRQGYTNHWTLRFLPAPKYQRPILIMGSIIILCYLCDRTNIFAKEQKQTSPTQFFTIMGALIAGSSLFTLKSSDKDLAFLNRDQTDEWKGWMQVAILVYHYVSVSKTPYIYQYVRVLPTSYLFMTGFGHTCYFLKKGDYSLKRFAATMLRLNLLNVILAYAMGNDWLLYYFAPLVTWNFFVIFGLLWLGNRHNTNTTFLVIKFIIAAGLNVAFYRIPGVLEACWSVLQATLRMQGDLREWRFRVTLDQFSVFPGMIAAILFNNWSKYELPKSTSWPTIRTCGVVASAIIVLGYAAFEASQPSKIAYNQKHPYTGWLPCCAFVVLRNATPRLRRTHNGFFAWVGRGSLETFLLQFHIWLAADTVGLLVLPGLEHYRLINALLTTIVFLWVSSKVTEATGPVIEWIMGNGTDTTPKPVAGNAISLAPTMSTAPGEPRGIGLGEKPGDAPGASAAIDATQPIQETAASGDLEKGTAPAELELRAPAESGASTDPSSSAPLIAASVGTASQVKSWTRDLRVRCIVVMGLLAAFNWTYYVL